MSDKSKIEWTDATWNPTVGCTIVSPGCTNCYAMKTAHSLERRFGSKKYSGLTKVVNGNPVWTGAIRLDDDALLQPLKWKRGRRIFVNSMSDLFHEDLPDEAIDKVFAVMALCPRHTFQILTKRAERMRAYLSNPDLEDRVTEIWQQFDDGDRETWSLLFPLSNVWLGVSAERQQEADERIPHLLQTPAAVRFISAEPLIGPIDLTRIHNPQGIAPGDTLDAFAPWGTRAQLDWIIVGGESGHNARPFNIEWADSIVEQCKAAGVSCFVKQLGAVPLSSGYPMELKNKKGGDWNEWPDRLRVRDWVHES